MVCCYKNNGEFTQESVGNPVYCGSLKIGVITEVTDKYIKIRMMNVRTKGADKNEAI